MYIVCEKCKKVFVDGKWVIAVPPIGHVKYTVCTDCEAPNETSNNMVYMEKQRKQHSLIRK